ncbi:aminoglycoside 6'-N-acetyltransferase [Saccharothrix ecbatanensis]|uniref:Aminoglycoside 6'-N-acetyltransferase n=1 Tax=Saccharothrix ecbatanensis TaxID=1105145 RepID=A0A7W9HUK1_9PSEU|nr:GNAT family protein [Saccharothrix ecbatanensis]MBB5808253.1 aminoglycoside 6'-N-acetyltransferase [Saccharothrix ecbatanensis]
MRLTTERLVLRPFTAADAPAFAAYRSDPDVARYQGWSAPFPLAQAEEFVREVGAADPTAPGWFQYAVEANGVLVGDVGVGVNENRMQADIGYTLATAHQGRGYAAEAVRRVLAHLFEERGLHRVAAECDARNERSARLLARLGFRQEGHRVRSTWAKGEWTDDLLFGLLATEWDSAAD